MFSKALIVGCVILSYAVMAHQNLLAGYIKDGLSMPQKLPFWFFSLTLLLLLCFIITTREINHQTVLINIFE